MPPTQPTGFSLVEVLVALSFLVLVSLGVIQLIVRSEQVADLASEQFAATNLAREGLELVRAVRDNNWFTEDRSQWIRNNMCGEFTYDIDMLRDDDSPGSENRSQLFEQSSGYWSHERRGGAKETRYSRVLEVDCSEKDNDPPRVLVTARVFWENRGQTREVVLKERLYNWLP